MRGLLNGALGLVILLVDPVLPVLGTLIEAPGPPVGIVIGVHLVGMVIQVILSAQSIPPADSDRNGPWLPQVTILSRERPGA